MIAPARTLALAAVIVALAFSAAPATASAGVGGTFCSLAGWVSGLVSKACTLATHAGRLVNAGKKLAGGHVGGAIGALAGSTSSKVARLAGIVAVAAGVVAGAQIAMKLTIGAVNTGTTPNLEAVWFSSSYWRMAAVAALLTVPFLCAAAIQAMLRSDLTLLLRSAFGYLPLGMLAVGVAAPLTALLLAGSDEMSAIVASASGHQGATFLGHVGALSTVISGASGTVFLSFFIALFTIAAAITLWLELLIRQAAVYVIVLMLPLFFAAMVWPARRIWAARAVELLVALILSKFAIVAVLGLGGAALGHTPLPGVGSLLAGTTLVLLAAFSPWAMLRLLPLHELAGAAVGGLRPHGVAPVQATDGRTQVATDAAEDAANGSATGADGPGVDPASEDVATRLPARLRALMQRGTAGQGSPGPAGPGESAPGPAQAPGESLGGATSPEVTPDGIAGGDDAAAGAATTTTGGATPGAAPTSAGGATPRAAPTPPASFAPAPAEPTPSPIPDPQTDAFGPTARDGELPEVFRSMGLDAEPMPIDQPVLDGGGPLPDPGPPPPPDPGDEPS
jgi:hypothetical protein